jgi:hypothetical protein
MTMHSQKISILRKAPLVLDRKECWPRLEGMSDDRPAVTRWTNLPDLLAVSPAEELLGSDQVSAVGGGYRHTFDVGPLCSMCRQRHGREIEHACE